MVEGVRIVLSRRLGGAEIAHTEENEPKNIPLPDFKADIDFKEKEQLFHMEL